MDKAKQTAGQLKDLLAICLAKAVDTSLTTYKGEHWFQDFLQEDQEKETKFQICQKRHTSVRDFDLQALMKFLRFCNEWSYYVFLYYGFYKDDDIYYNQTQKRQINLLLDRLITDFRNQIEAHTRVADIELELEHKQVDRIYGYKEATHDMLKLASIFKNVCDKQGNSYHTKMCELHNPQKRKWMFPIVIVVLLTIIASVLLIIKLKDGTDNVVFDSYDISIQPKEVYYDGDELVAICYIVNGTDYTVYDIDLKELQLQNEYVEIANANFGLIKGVKIPPKSYIEHTFRFPSNTIYTYGANLNQVTTHIRYNNKHY